MLMPKDLAPDDDLLLDDGLPCLRRDGRLYYLNDVQPRVLEACRGFGLSFDQLADKLGIMRPALVLILKGYDPVPPNLKSVIDRLVTPAVPVRDDAMPAPDSESDAPQAAPLQKTTILSVPVPEPAMARQSAAAATVVVDALPVQEATDMAVIPDVVSLDRPATPHVVMPAPATVTKELPGFTPDLRRAPRRRGTRDRGGKPGQFLLT